MPRVLKVIVRHLLAYETGVDTFGFLRHFIDWF